MLLKLRLRPEIRMPYWVILLTSLLQQAIFFLLVFEFSRLNLENGDLATMEGSLPLVCHGMGRV